MISVGTKSEVANMAKTYINKNSLPGPTSIWIKDKEIIWTGIVIDSMGVNCKNETYEFLDVTEFKRRI